MKTAIAPEAVIAGSFSAKFEDSCSWVSIFFKNSKLPSFFLLNRISNIPGIEILIAEAAKADIKRNTHGKNKADLQSSQINGIFHLLAKID
jgi:hypothetical protein